MRGHDRAPQGEQLIVGGFLGWLLVLSWPVLTPGRRATRLIIVVAVLGLAVLKFLGRF